ncbi:MAG: hypothetical protein WA946_08985 [Nitrospirota bacterium]
MGQKMASLHLWLILAAGCLGVVMGINRTIKTREHESSTLQNLSAIVGVLLIGASIYAIVTSGGLTVRTSYTVLLMLILGLSLSARQLGSIPIVAVVILILGLGGLYVFGHTGMPHNLHELLQTRSPKIMIISVVIVMCGFVVLAMTTVEMLVHMVLNVLGQGIVVIVLSAISMIHAGLVLFTGDGRGLLKFM